MDSQFTTELLGYIAELEYLRLLPFPLGGITIKCTPKCYQACSLGFRSGIDLLRSKGNIDISGLRPTNKHSWTIRGSAIMGGCWTDDLHLSYRSQQSHRWHCVEASVDRLPAFWWTIRPWLSTLQWTLGDKVLVSQRQNRSLVESMCSGTLNWIGTT